MGACVAGAAWEAALALLAGAASRRLGLDVVACNTALNALGIAGRWRQALAFLLTDMEAQSVRPNAVSFNTAVAACGRHGAWAVVATLLDEMRRRGESPDAVTYRTLIGSDRGVDPEGLLEEMRAARLEPGLAGYNAALAALVDGGRDRSGQPATGAGPAAWLRALRLLRRMDAEALEPDLAAWNAALAACGQGEQWQRALDILECLQRGGGLAPDAVTFCAAAAACERASRWADGVRRHAVSCAVAAAAWRRGRRWEEAAALLSGAGSPTAARRHDADAGAAANAVAFAAAIGACERGHAWQRALDLLQKAQRQSVEVGTAAYNAAIGACEKRKKWRWALHLVGELPQLRLQPDTCTVNIAMSACEYPRQWELAAALLEEMPRRELGPDAISCNALMAACEKASRWEASLAVFQSMSRLGLRPDAISCSIALAACERGRRWQAALAIAHELRASRAHADVLGLTSAATACEQGLQARAAAGPLQGAAALAERWAWTGDRQLVQGDDPHVLLLSLEELLVARMAWPRTADLALARRVGRPVCGRLLQLAAGLGGQPRQGGAGATREVDPVLEGVAGLARGTAQALEVLGGDPWRAQGSALCDLRHQAVLAACVGTSFGDQGAGSCVLPADPVAALLLACLEFDLAGRPAARWIANSGREAEVVRAARLEV